MSEVADYYGTKQGTTYLEIYSVLDDSAERVVHRQLRDEEAYDTWHLSLYMKEILAYRRLLRQRETSFADLPRPEKNLLVYLLLSACPRLMHVVELGSSLYEMIDGMTLFDRHFEARGKPIARPDLRGRQYTGVEISDLLIQAAEQLHPDHQLRHVKRCDALPSAIDLLYDRNVSSYAFTSSEALAELMNRCDVALMNLFLSRGETFLSARLGKGLTYFSLDQLLSHLDKPLYHLFGFKAPGPHDGADLSRGRPVVEGFFLLADPEDARAFMRTAESDPDVAAYFQTKNIALTPAASLLATA